MLGLGPFSARAWLRAQVQLTQGAASPAPAQLPIHRVAMNHLSNAPVNGVERHHVGLDHGIFEEFGAAEGTSPSLFAVAVRRQGPTSLVSLRSTGSACCACIVRCAIDMKSLCTAQIGPDAGPRQCDLSSSRNDLRSRKLWTERSLRSVIWLPNATINHYRDLPNATIILRRGKP
jgi:hypothetical protein